MYLLIPCFNISKKLSKEDEEAILPATDTSEEDLDLNMSITKDEVENIIENFKNKCHKVEQKKNTPR